MISKEKQRNHFWCLSRRSCRLKCHTIYIQWGFTAPEWLTVDTEEEKVDMLHDVRIVKALRKQDMEHRIVSWILGQDGVEEYWI